MKFLTLILTAVVSTTVLAMDEPMIRTVTHAQLDSVREQMLGNQYNVIGTFIDQGQAHILYYPASVESRGSHVPLTAGGPTWLRNGWKAYAALDYNRVDSIECGNHQEPALEQRWHAAQQLIDSAKLLGHATAEAEALLADAKVQLTEASAIEAINAAVRAELGTAVSPSQVVASVVPGLYVDPYGDTVPMAMQVENTAMPMDLYDHISDRFHIQVFNYWVGRVYIYVALVDGGDTVFVMDGAKKKYYHWTPSAVTEYKTSIAKGMSWLSAQALARNIPQDWVIEYLENNDTGSVRVPTSPWSMPCGSILGGTGGMVGWIRQVMESQRYYGHFDAMLQWMNDTRRREAANHATLMLVPWTAGHDSMGLGTDGPIGWANAIGYPDWEGRKLSGLYGHAGTGSDKERFEKRFIHELMHQPGAADLAGYACDESKECNYEWGENRTPNSTCWNCSYRGPSIMCAWEIAWHMDENSLSQIGWTIDGTDYWPRAVDPNCYWYWLFWRPGLTKGSALTFMTPDIDLSDVFFLETIICNEYTGVLSPFTGQFNASFNGSDPFKRCLEGSRIIWTALNFDLGTTDQAPALKGFHQRSPTFAVEESALGFRLGLRDFLGHLFVEFPGYKPVRNGWIYLGHPAQLTWYELPTPLMLPGMKTVRIKGAYADWDVSVELPLILGPQATPSCGDVNLNGASYEVADAVLYSNYFIQGPTVFDPLFLSAHSIACEVNQDGVSFTVSDLVYLIRVLTGTAPALAKISPMQSAYIWTEGNEVWLETPVELSALALTLTGMTSDPHMQVADSRYQREGDTVRCLNLEGSYASVIVPAGRTLIARCAPSDIPQVEYSTASTQDGTEVPLVHSRAPVPYVFSLSQNHPNPFNAATVINYSLPHDQLIELVIYNVLGRRVKTLEQGYRTIGDHSVVWDGSTDDGKDAASGVYFYALNYEGERKDVKRMLFLK